MFPCTGLTCMIEERFIINIELAESPLPQSVSLQTIIRIMAQQNYCSPSCIEEIKPEPLTNMTSILVYFKWWGGHNSFMEHLPQKWLLFDLWTTQGFTSPTELYFAGASQPQKVFNYVPPLTPHPFNSLITQYRFVGMKDWTFL